MAKLPLPVGSEVGCGFRRGSSISELSLRPLALPKYPYLRTGTYQQDHDTVQGKERRFGYLPRAYNRLFKADRRAHSRPEVTLVSERAFDGDLCLDPWSENTGS